MRIQINNGQCGLLSLQIDSKSLDTKPGTNQATSQHRSYLYGTINSVRQQSGYPCIRGFSVQSKVCLSVEARTFETVDIETSFSVYLNLNLELP